MRSGVAGAKAADPADFGHRPKPATTFFEVACPVACRFACSARRPTAARRCSSSRASSCAASRRSCPRRAAIRFMNSVRPCRAGGARSFPARLRRTRLARRPRATLRLTWQTRWRVHPPRPRAAAGASCSCASSAKTVCAALRRSPGGGRVHHREESDPRNSRALGAFHDRPPIAPARSTSPDESTVRQDDVPELQQSRR